MPFLSHDGINLHYETAGSGPAIVFIHGWCCNLTHFQKQFDHFSSTHKVVSVDLRGHGESDKPEGDYSMPVFADDVAFVCRELGIDKVVAVGHSMGGSVIAAMAARHPDLVTGAIAVDSGIIATEGSRSRIGPRIEAMSGTNYVEAALDLVNTMFEPYDDQVRCQEIAASMTSVPQHTMISAMSGNMANTAESLGTVSQPFLLISAGRLPIDLTGIREAVPNLRYAQSYGSGHFSMLEVPDQINAMIERFLAIELAKA